MAKRRVDARFFSEKLLHKVAHGELRDLMVTSHLWQASTWIFGSISLDGLDGAGVRAVRALPPPHRLEKPPVSLNSFFTLCTVVRLLQSCVRWQ